jgi:hypothetical protein
LFPFLAALKSIGSVVILLIHGTQESWTEVQLIQVARPRKKATGADDLLSQSVGKSCLVVVHSGGQKNCALIALWVDRQVGCASHHRNRVHRNGIKLLGLGWKSPPSADYKNNCHCDAAQDTHGRSPLGFSCELLPSN